MAQTMRVHELVQELKKSGREVMDRLRKLGIPAKSNLSTLTPEQVNKLRESFGLKVEPIPKEEKKPVKKKAKADKKKPAKKPKKAAKPAAKKAMKPKKAPVKKKPAKKEAAAEKKPPKKVTVKEKELKPATKKGKKDVVPEELIKEKVVVELEPRPVKAAEPPKREPVRAEKPVKPPVSEETKIRKKAPVKEEPSAPPKKKPGKRIYRYRPKGAFKSRPGAPPTTVAPKLIRVPEGITVKEFAQKVGRKPSDIIRQLMEMGDMLTVNQPMPLEAIKIISEEISVEIKVKESQRVERFIEVVDKPEELLHRPPVVTVMGHVDHGKTLLLDAIKETDVASGEAGGITQHIGAYQVTHDGKQITFIDTPGHESFTALRARGARVTDIAVLVVAADDGVMPQTIEAIDHAREADVPILVAVNKIDKQNANPEQVRRQLVEHGLVPEEWGGDNIFVDVSAKEKTNLKQLLEMILLMAEMMELSANPNAEASGVVIESKLERGKGPIATVLIKRGTARVGNNVVGGTSFGKIRAMQNENGDIVIEATPSQPVEVIGLSEVPEAGEEIRVVSDSRRARQISEARKVKKEEEDRAVRKHVSLENLLEAIEEGETNELKLIIKGDVHGSVEAVVDSIAKLEKEQLRINIIHKGVGAVNESDVMLAAASNAIVIGFNTIPTPKASVSAERESVDVRTYQVIYQLTEDIDNALEGMLEPETEEVVTGRAEVRQMFKVPKAGMVAGSYVTEGEIKRTSMVRVFRDEVFTYEGRIASLKRFKDDVRSVSEGYECGIAIEDFKDLKPGDILEAFEIVEVTQ